MQIPMVGRDCLYRSRITSAALTLFNPIMQAENAPTPGTTNPVASRATSGFEVRMTV
jgi:hypothetical protein